MPKPVFTQILNSSHERGIIKSCIILLGIPNTLQANHHETGWKKCTKKGYTKEGIRKYFKDGFELTCSLLAVIKVPCSLIYVKS